MAKPLLALPNVMALLFIMHEYNDESETLWNEIRQVNPEGKIGAFTFLEEFFFLCPGNNCSLTGGNSSLFIMVCTLVLARDTVT